MKLNRKGFLIVAAAACFATSVNTQTSQAGQWLDAVLGRRPPAYPVGTPVPVNGQVSAYSPGAYPSLGYVPPSYANLNSNFNNTQTLGYGSYMAPTANNAPLLPPGFPQTVAGYLPTAAYDTQWARTPVTYYRPVTAFDPRYGTTVTSLQPCTSYQYQAQRQPVIAPRPLLGDYGFQANRWPSITGPGYNPTGLAAAPTYPTYQSIPNGGMPAIGQPALGQPVFGQPAYGQTSAMAPIGGTGVSSGMPASTMPLATMQYNPANNAPFATQQAYYASPGYTYAGTSYGNQNYASQGLGNPTYATNYSSALNTPSSGLQSQTIGSGVMPTAAWLPSTSACANGMCPQTSQMNTPNIPGAASVVPVGPPTYSSVPSSNLGGPVAGYNPASTSLPSNLATPGYTNPYSANPVFPNAAPPVFPNNQVMPPVNNSGSDPEADKRPSLGNKLSSDGLRTQGENLTNQLAVPAANPQTIPMVAIDREPNPKNNETSSGMVNPNLANQPRNAMALGNPSTKEESNGSKTNAFGTAPQIPQTLTPRGNYGMKPLDAPEDLDSNPRWTPTLLDPDDRVAIERAAKRVEESKRIRMIDDSESAVSAVAIESKKELHNPIQLVSGVENKKSELSDSGVIRFRPVTKLK